MVLRSPTLLALAASLALHAAGLALLRDVLSPGAPRRVTLVALDAARWARNRGAPPASPPAAPRAETARDARARTDPPPPAPRGRLVEVVPAPDRTPPRTARFLADEDGTARRDTRAPVPPGPRPAALAPRHVPGPAARGGVAARGEGGERDVSVAGALGPAGEVARVSPPVPRGDEAVTAARRVLASLGGEGGARRSGTFDPRVLPVSALAPVAGGGAPRAVPAWVEEGSETWLSTRKFQHAEFYRRVADAIRGQWDPNRVWDARDPADRVLGRTSRVTVLEITLDPEGRLLEVEVRRGSGVDFLDRECLRAVRAVGRFPNPPDALVRDGRVRLAEWPMRFSWRPEGAVLDRVLGLTPRVPGPPNGAAP